MRRLDTIKGVIYLFEWNKKPFYWGIAEKNSFGVRYNPGYRHLIQASLANGGKLYIAEVEDQGETPLRDIENYLMVAHGYVANTRVNVEGPTFALKHKGNVPASVEISNGSADFDHSLIDSSHSTKHLASHRRNQIENNKPIWKYGLTHAQEGLFAYKVERRSLIIKRGTDLKLTDELNGENLIQLQENLIEKFGNESFPLDNSVTPKPDREIGLGTVIVTTFSKPRGFAQVATQLSVLLCEIGIFTRYIKPNRIYGNRYLLNCNQLPESWSEMSEWLDSLPDNTHLAPD